MDSPHFHAIFFWITKPCSHVRVWEYVRRIRCLKLFHEDGGKIFSQNISNHLTSFHIVTTHKDRNISFNYHDDSFASYTRPSVCFFVRLTGSLEPGNSPIIATPVEKAAESLIICYTSFRTIKPSLLFPVFLFRPTCYWTMRRDRCLASFSTENTHKFQTVIHLPYKVH